MSPATTHPSLLDRLRHRSDSEAWREFDARYGDLVLRYCRSRGLQHADADDVRQIVMFSLSKVLPGFQYSPHLGKFRSYLGQVVNRAVLQFHRGQRPDRLVLSLESIEAIVDGATEAPPDAQWDREWADHHYRLAMRTVRATHEARSIEIFDRILAGQNLQELTEEFGMSEQAIHKVKQRIRDRLRELIAKQVRDENEAQHETR